MIINDPLIHPAFIDPRQWGDVSLYELNPPVEREPVLGKPHFRADREFDVRHLRLTLRVDDAKETIEGSAEMTVVVVADGLSHIDLDAAEMSVSKVVLAGKTVPFESRGEKLNIEPGREFARGDELTVAIFYKCKPRKGLFFIKPDDAYPTKPEQIWSQGENEDAHWWFPCADVTNQKMTSELIATVRSDFFVLSNGKLIDDTEDAQQKTRTFHWRQDEPHPAYLVTMVAGKYEKIADEYGPLAVDYYVYPDKVEEGRRAFENTPRMIEFFESRFGYKYPFAKYSQILVDDFLFGAMENTSATTMTDRILLDERARIDINYDDIVAHELAHQWWGDLVTCKDWSEIWLNESFATYSEFLWRQQSVGDAEARFALFQDTLVYLREDRRSHRRPIVCNRYRYSEELMDRHAYEKGAFVLSMLRKTLGDEGFFRSLAQYLNQNAFGAAETSDFRVAIEAATGRNLSWFFDQWVHGEGVPELRVFHEWRREDESLHITVRQVQLLDGGTRFFKLPLEIEVVTGIPGDEQRQTYKVVIENAHQELYFPCKTRPLMVVFDKGHTLLKLLHFPKSDREWIYQMHHDEDVLGRVRAARELSSFKTEAVSESMRKKVKGGDFWGVRFAAALTLGQIPFPENGHTLIELLDGCDDARVRRGIVCALGNFKDEKVVATLEKVIENDQSYFVCAAAARALANIGTTAAYDILTRSLAGASWQQIVRVAILNGFAAAKDKRALEHGFTYSRYGEHPGVRVAAITLLGAIGKELHAEGSDDRVVDHLTGLLKDKSIRARVTAIRALGRIGNARALGPLRESMNTECLDQLKASIEDAIDGIEKSARKRPTPEIIEKSLQQELS